MTTTNLIWATPEAEKMIVHCGRVSNPPSQQAGQNNERLIKYLINHKHWSPFEMASMCVEVETTKDVSIQILRHRSFSFQEFSQRYASVTDHLGLDPSFELRRQDQKNRQSSFDTDEFEAPFRHRIEKLFTEARGLYEDMLQAGVARESARKVLPITAGTRLYMTGTIRSFIHYCLVRCHADTQKEHREVAHQILSIIQASFPTTGKVLHELLHSPTA